MADTLQHQPSPGSVLYFQYKEIKPLPLRHRSSGKQHKDPVKEYERSKRFPSPNIIDTTEPLPSSPKGYVLYLKTQSQARHFSLLFPIKEPSMRCKFHTHCLLLLRYHVSAVSQFVVLC